MCEEQKSCCHKTKKRTEQEIRNLVSRLNRVEGQIRGIRRMLDDDAYCTDILIQISAATAALNSVSRLLLENHIRTCVVEDIRQGKDETVEDLVTTLKTVIK